MKTNHIESNTIFRENVGLPIKKKDGRFANKNKTVSISALKSAALKKKTKKQTHNQTNNNLKNSKKYNKEQIGSFGFGHTGI